MILDRVDALTAVDLASRVLENDGRTTRALHGCHLDSPLFDNLTRLPVLLETAKVILQSDVYLYQFKINIKAAFRGDVWPWHQDYIFWHNEDGMPNPRAVSVLVFLDEVTEFNGPVYFMPGSHQEGQIELPASEAIGRDSWHRDVSADLKCRIDEEKVAGLVRRYGIEAPKGPSGSALFFHCNIVHGSPSNISPFSRRMIILTYNSTENVQCSDRPARPEFLVGRDFRPLEPLREKAGEWLI